MPDFMIQSLLKSLVLMCAACGNLSDAYADSQVSIPFIKIRAAGDSFSMGDGVLGPNAVQAISYDFSMSKHPITNSQFARFIEDGGYAEKSLWTSNGWRWKGKKDQPAHWGEHGFSGPEQPVIGVSWYEAVAFCNWLCVNEGLRPIYDLRGQADLHAPGYRLPTETEWEYAAVKGSPLHAERIYPWGDEWDPQRAVCSVDSEQSSTAHVGSRSPHGDTPQGLTDMSGNVWQWCSDNVQRDDKIGGFPSIDRYYFKDDSPAARMVLRGGSWGNNFLNGFRSAFRGFPGPPTNRYNVIGFRVVRR